MNAALWLQADRAAGFGAIKAALATLDTDARSAALQWVLSQERLRQTVPSMFALLLHVVNAAAPVDDAPEHPLRRAGSRRAHARVAAITGGGNVLRAVVVGLAGPVGVSGGTVRPFGLRSRMARSAALRGRWLRVFVCG